MCIVTTCATPTPTGALCGPCEAFLAGCGAEAMLEGLGADEAALAAYRAGQREHEAVGREVED